MPNHRRKRDINGILLLDKPTGRSSNNVLQAAKQVFAAKKAGHTGNLDPLATGLLPICFGQATKLSEYALGSAKKYIATLRLGITTDTLDAHGLEVQRRPVDVSEQALQEATEHFRGSIQQLPPMFSALKKDGQPLYKLARKGIEVERKPRAMTVYELNARLVEPDKVELDVHCSSGFYVRSLAHDLGELLGCGAHIAELRRTASGNLHVNDAISLDALSEITELGQLDELLHPLDILVEHLDKVEISFEQAREFLFGKIVTCDIPQSDGLLRLYLPDNELFAIGQRIGTNQLRTRKILKPNLDQT